MPAFTNTPSLFDNQDAIGLAEFVETLRRRWRLVVGISAVCTIAAVGYVLLSHPLFTLNGTVYFGDTRTPASTGGAAADFLTEFQNVSDVATQSQLLQSKAQVEQAVLETGLNATVAPLNSVDMPYWRWRMQYGEAVQAFAPRPGDLAVQYATFSDPGSRGQDYVLQIGHDGRYRLMTGRDWSSNGTIVLSGSLGRPASGNGLSLLVKAQPDGVAPAAGRLFSLQISPAKAVADKLLSGPLAVTAGGSVTAPTELANVKLTWGDPYKGQLFLNQLMQDYIATQLSWKTQSASNSEEFIASQLLKIREAMTTADNALANYQAKTGIVDVPVNAQAVINQLSQYQVQRTTIFLQQQALRELDGATAHPARGMNPYLVSEASDPVLSGLATSLATAQAQLAAQRVQFTQLAPEAQVQEATVAKLESAIRSLVINDESLATSNLANIDKLIATYEAQLRVMPAQSLQVIALTRSSNVLGQIYVLLMQKEQEAEVSKAATIMNTRVVTPAEIPLYATRPRSTITVVAGLVGGLLAGVVSVLTMRAVSGRYQSDTEIRRAVPLRIYGMVPKWQFSGGGQTVVPRDRQSAFTEAFRLIRSNLYFPEMLHAPRVVMLTSPGLGDGKTTIACNLASMLAADGKKVVLVDADLHQGQVHKALQVDQGPGLAEWLEQDARVPIQRCAGFGFAVLTAGAYPPNPSELINHARMGDIIARLKGEFEYVIVDCPPLPLVSDTLSLAKYAELTLSVVYIGHTERRDFALHSEAIGAVRSARGIVINGVAVSGTYDGYGDYRRGTGHYGTRLTRRLPVRSAPEKGPLH